MYKSRTAFVWLVSAAIAASLVFAIGVGSIRWKEPTESAAITAEEVARRTQEITRLRERIEESEEYVEQVSKGAIEIQGVAPHEFLRQSRATIAHSRAELKKMEDELAERLLSLTQAPTSQ